jgi:Na+/H+ antiporter NhaD/arsenite permease-like protein
LDHILAFIIFTLSYIGIIAEKINRAVVVCAGGLAMILVGIIDVEKTFMEHIEWNTIALLLAMMVIVSITSQNGVFEFVAVKLAQLAGGKPIPLLITLSTLTAIGSAFLDNVTTVLLLVPIILTLTSILNVSSMPYLITTILFSNIGGTATLIGDPPNIMIGQAVEHLDFLDFLYNLTPIVILIYIVILGYIILIYRKSLHISKANQRRLLSINASTYLKKGPLMYKSLSVLLLTIVGFLIHPIFHIDLTAVAMAGAVVLMLITQNEQDAEEVFKSIEWVTIFFFIGLFMLIGGLKEVGIIDEIARSILYYTKGDLPLTAIVILWGSGIVSGFVDNIPFVAAMIPVITEFQDYGMHNLDPLWWSLALGSCLGGNATLIGASANVIVAGFAAKAKQPISFIKFMYIGVQVVFISLIISTIYIYFRYLIPYLS